MDWERTIRKLWVDYLVWVRDYIYLLMRRQDNMQYAEDRLTRLIGDFTSFWASFYGEQSAQQFGDLLRRHIDILAEYTATLHAKENTEPLRDLWYSNAEAAARLLASVNPYWDEAKWLELLYNQNAAEEFLIWVLHRDSLAEAMTKYDDFYYTIESTIMYMIEGLKKQFPEKST